MDAAENMAMSFEHKEADRAFSYYNAKEMVEPGEASTHDAGAESHHSLNKFTAISVPPKELVLHPDPHFFNQRVNKSLSAVHVPTNVFDRGGWTRTGTFKGILIINDFCLLFLPSFPQPSK